MDIYQNFSLCDNNCNYEKLNTTTMMITCKCKVKEKISTEIEKPNFSNIIKTTFKDSNFFVIICYKLVFSINNKSNNIGFLDIFNINYFTYTSYYILFFVWI